MQQTWQYCNTLLLLYNSVLSEQNFMHTSPILSSKALHDYMHLHVDKLPLHPARNTLNCND